jgi:hypothetical protein
MKIFLLHLHQYWTEYLDFLLDDEENFGIVRSVNADSKSYKGKKLALFNPKEHDILLSPGLFDDPLEDNFVICRNLHSPGFYVLPHIIAYRCLTKCCSDGNFLMFLIESHYMALMCRDFEHSIFDEIRYEMMLDQRVKQTSVDISMYRIKEARRCVDRVPGTGLICFRWLAQYVDIQRIVEVLKVLLQDLKLSFVIHPCTSSQKWIEEVKKLEGNLIEKVYVAIPRSELITLFDEHEFVISDGSGSCYESLLRGCKQLAVHDLYDDIPPLNRGMEMVYDRLEEEFFPFRSYRDLKNYREGENDGFIEKMYPFLFNKTRAQAEEIVRQEILQCVSQ